jgi:hypothetical protein
MGFYVVAFPSNASTFCPQQAVSPSYIHRNAVSLCHTPTLKFHGLPPNGTERETQNLVRWMRRWYVTDPTNRGCHFNYLLVRRALIQQYNNNNNVVQEALRLRCVCSICCGVLLNKKLKSWYGVLCCGFSFKCFNVLPSASSKPILHTP